MVRKTALNPTFVRPLRVATLIENTDSDDSVVRCEPPDVTLHSVQGLDRSPTCSAHVPPPYRLGRWSGAHLGRDVDDAAVGTFAVCRAGHVAVGRLLPRGSPNFGCSAIGVVHLGPNDLAPLDFKLLRSTVERVDAFPDGLAW